MSTTTTIYADTLFQYRGGTIALYIAQNSYIYFIFLNFFFTTGLDTNTHKYNFIHNNNNFHCQLVSTNVCKDTIIL